MLQYSLNELLLLLLDHFKEVRFLLPDWGLGLLLLYLCHQFIIVINFTLLSFQIKMDKKQDVLTAILNVRRYTKELKQNASIYQESQAFSPSKLSSKDEKSVKFGQFLGDSTAGLKEKGKELFDSRSTKLIAKDVIATETLSCRRSPIKFRETNLQLNIQSDGDAQPRSYVKSKNVHSTIDPNTKCHKNVKPKIEKNIKHNVNPYANTSQEIKDQPQRYFLGHGHSQTFTNLNDIQFQKTINQPKQRKHILNHSQSPQKIHSNTSINKKLNEEKKNQRKEQESCGINKNSEDLLQKINSLEKIIEDYQKVVLKMKTKYFQLQSKQTEQIKNEQLIDILKSKINECEKRNQQLLEKIDLQKQKIEKYQEKMMEGFKKFEQNYLKTLEENLKMHKENEYLKNMLKLTIVNEEEINLKECRTSTQESDDIKQNITKMNISKNKERLELKYMLVK